VDVCPEKKQQSPLGAQSPQNWKHPAEAGRTWMDNTDRIVIRTVRPSRVKRRFLIVDLL